MAIEIGRFGLWTGSRSWDGDDAEHREALAEIDELGYGALWLGMAPGDLRQVQALLGATKKLVVATGIVNVWEHEAADLAAAYQRVDRVHPGRALVGIGPSHAPIVEKSGQAYDKPFSKLRSYVDELDAADDPLPPQARVLAALGPRALALAGEKAAGAHPYLTTPEHTAFAREVLGDGPLLAPEQKVVLETDPARAREIARSRTAPYLGLPNYVNNLRRFGFTDADFADGGSDRLIDALVVRGDVDAVADRVRAHREAGADHVCLQVLDSGSALPREQWRELAPALRG
ncbi:LLM class F420-dependent oxidoreductase [Saccharopolyspora sp. NFXS83]|uniref:LLM class F420-dependent oxidoreductase n=1 Tax=Saccharopolyspora sp. NFXS83 TaxID=2993560 RepID=UPI00224B9A52|nr:LLM class F420-dependent oxidoreductase [Saccharopolyspora sp. NFXS83]MCX2729717.1 LLM class F420-dependent oxidoreductase [Saccharopolyspora sp. NFXS83]